MDLKTITYSEVPIVLKNVLNWELCSWTSNDWEDVLVNEARSEKFTFRKGNRNCSKEPQWERYCDSVQFTMPDFFQNYFSRSDRGNEGWLYFDYKHIAEWFSSKKEWQEVTWGDFGHPEKTLRDSTIWIGTQGAHTACHIDSYGCNLVAQLFGKKVWYLFPPSESAHLKPTRVPYEESSVYSKINFACGCGDISEIKHIRTVVLEPGDVLFVPHNWWHYVENLSSAISVNVWLEDPQDDESRLEEALVKYFISSVSRSIDENERKDVLNPNEEDVPNYQEKFNIEEVRWCLQQSRPTKLPTLERKKSLLHSSFEVPEISPEDFKMMHKNKCLHLDRSEESELSRKESRLFRRDVINAFCDPEVIALVREKLKKVTTS